MGKHSIARERNSTADYRIRKHSMNFFFIRLPETNLGRNAMGRTKRNHANGVVDPCLIDKAQGTSGGNQEKGWRMEDGGWRSKAGGRGAA